MLLLPGENRRIDPPRKDVSRFYNKKRGSHEPLFLFGRNPGLHPAESDLQGEDMVGILPRNDARLFGVVTSIDFEGP